MNCYLKLCTEFYDIDKPHPPADALEFYFGSAWQAKGLILEPMCGSGRFLIPLLEKGFDVIGADASSHMLAACREHLRSRKFAGRVDLRQQFLHELDISPNRDASLVLIPSGSLQLVTDMDHVRESLRRIFDVLRPGGTFVFEASIGKPKESASWPWGGRWITRPSDGARILISWLGHYDAVTSINCNLHRYELFKDGQLLATEIEEFDMRQYSADELRSLLEQAGFAQVRMFENFDPSKPASDSSRDEIVIECRKPA
jgi:SAM-dependent methyltransferase